MFRNPCKRGGNIVLSIVSFIFLSTSAAALSLTIHDSQNIPFLKNNDKEFTFRVKIGVVEEYLADNKIESQDYLETKGRQWLEQKIEEELRERK